MATTEYDRGYDAGFDWGKAVGGTEALRGISEHGAVRVRQLPDGFYQAIDVEEANDQIGLVDFIMGSLFGAIVGFLLAFAVL